MHSCSFLSCDYLQLAFDEHRWSDVVSLVLTELVSDYIILLYMYGEGGGRKCTEWYLYASSYPETLIVQVNHIVTHAAHNCICIFCCLLKDFHL